MDQKIIWILLVGLIVAVAVVMLQPLFPILDRIQFDMICHRYFLIMKKENGLTNDSEAELRSQLENRAFQVNDISASSDVNYGDEIVLTVNVSKEYKELQPTILYKKVTRPMSYDAKDIALGVGR